MKFILCSVLLSYSMYANAYLECQNQVNNVSASWTVDQHGPYTGVPGYAIGSGTLVCFASGAELKYIKSNFTGLRSYPSMEVLWTGDDADFINANLGQP